MPPALSWSNDLGLLYPDNGSGMLL